MMALIEAEGVVRTFKQADQLVTALNDIHLRIDSGAFVAITGESGSGKTTLLSLLAALDRPTRGTIRFDGERLETASSRRLAELRRDSIGIVFQDFKLFRHLSALDNVRLPALFSGGAGGLADARMLIEKVNLQHRMKHRPDELSRGEMQRIAIARALVNRPKVIFADEPTANLDRRNSDTIWEILQALNGNDGVTIVVATHSIVHLLHSLRIVRLDDGRLVSDEIR